MRFAFPLPPASRGSSLTVKTSPTPTIDHIPRARIARYEHHLSRGETGRSRLHGGRSRCRVALRSFGVESVKPVLKPVQAGSVIASNAPVVRVGGRQGQWLRRQRHHSVAARVRRENAQCCRRSLWRARRGATMCAGRLSRGLRPTRKGLAPRHSRSRDASGKRAARVTEVMAQSGRARRRIMTTAPGRRAQHAEFALPWPKIGRVRRQSCSSAASRGRSKNSKAAIHHGERQS